MSALLLPLERLLDGADHVRRTGALDPTSLAADAGTDPWTPELLRSALDTVAEPVLRATVEGRLGDVVEVVEVWASDELTVLAAPLDDGRHEVVAGHTSHLPLQLAAALGLGPRPRAHGVDGPLRLPASALVEVLSGAGFEAPAGLPPAWLEVLDAWRAPVRQLRLTTGWYDADVGERWSSVEVIDDLDRGPFLVQPTGAPGAGQVVVSPTDPTRLLRLVSRLLTVGPA